MKSFEVDAKEVLNMFAELDYKHQKRAYRNALKKATRILSKETKRNLKSEIGKAAYHKGKYGTSLAQGIKTKVAKDAKSAKVHIMGDYRLKWFELGTVDRYLRKRKHAYRGRMRARYFFKKARDTKFDEMNNSIHDILTESIKKVANNNK